MKISQNFVAFSEYMNFTKVHTKFQGGFDGLEAGGREEAIFHDRHRRPEDPRPR